MVTDMNAPKWRSKTVLVAAACGVAAVIAGVVALILSSSGPPSDEECRAELLAAAQGEDLSPACAEWVNSIAQEIQQQADIASACQDAIARDHDQKWTIPLTFDSVEIEEAPGRDHRVSGEAHFRMGTSALHEYTYACTIRLDGEEPRVLSSNLSSR